jgi:FdrA protein
MTGFVLSDVRKGLYLDSVALMRISRALKNMPGVQEAALMMGTPSNRQILADVGLLVGDGQNAQGNDLIIGIRAENESSAREALQQALSQIAAPRAQNETKGELLPRSIRSALKHLPDATVVLISVPGEFAIPEARKAVRRGLHAMIFSDNVPLEQELELKKEARSLGRLVMGPDCGTALIAGVPLAFANLVRRGDIGIVGASGTGIQEVTTLISKAGGGISHAIGVGGRDLSREIGGISTLMAIDALDEDPGTRHIVLISKPPHPDVMKTVLERVSKSMKKFTVCFLGAGGMELPPNARFAPTLKGAAEGALGRSIAGASLHIKAVPTKPGHVVGLYSGGTLCAEAQVLLMHEGRSVMSNVPIKGASSLADNRQADRIIDLGSDEYTKGRPHPMIDPSVRDEMLRKTIGEQSVGAILIDVVIGYGAHPDPAGHIASMIESAPERHPAIVASVTGTDDDHQGFARQVKTLETAGVMVAPSNADAVLFALRCIAR